MVLHYNNSAFKDVRAKINQMETIPSLLFAKRNDADDEVVITCQKCTVN